MADELSRHVADLRILLGEMRGLRESSFPSSQTRQIPLRAWGVREQFHTELAEVEETLATYRRQLESKMLDESPIADNEREWKTVGQIEAALEVVHRALDREDWTLHEVQIDKLDGKLIDLQRLTSELPSHLYSRFRGFAAAERSEYRTLIIGTWIAAALAAMIFGLFINLFYQWIFRPLRILIEGSRFVAAGQFSYRIHLRSGDEMAAEYLRQPAVLEIVAQALALPLERVLIRNPDTDRVPDSGPTVASRSIMTVGRLLERAALRLKQEWKPGEEQLIEERYKEPDFMIPFDPESFQGDAYPTYNWSVDVVEVCVDALTGETEITGAWAVYDVGVPIDENILRGQMEGGLLQGIGYASIEQMAADGIKNALVFATSAWGGLLDLMRRQAATDRVVPALRDVSFEVPKGSALCVIGRNGAGKSTLLRCLAGILVPEQGRVTARGRITSLLSVGIGMNAKLTGRENIKLGGLAVGIDGSRLADITGDIAEFAQLGEYIDYPVETYSSGMRARLGFAVAAHLDPEIVLIDEALTGGDSKFQSRVAEKMNEMTSGGRTIVLVTHGMMAVLEMASQGIWMHQGQVMEKGDPEQVVAAYMRYCRLESTEMDMD